MKEFIKNNLAVVLAFVLPVVLIIIVALSAYIPSFFLSTDYNFIYTICTDNNNHYSYYCNEYIQKRYSVANGKLIVNSVEFSKNSIGDAPAPDFSRYVDRIFLHNTQKNESQEITLEEAKALTLSSLLTSADGVMVSGYYNDSGLFSIFGGGYSSFGYYLTKGKSKKKLNLINNSNQNYYPNNFQFIGWVLPAGSVK